MDIFNHENQTINWEGKSFPYRICNVNDTEYPYSIIISVIELEHLLIERNGVPKSKDAEWIDDRIAYYVEKEEDLYKNDSSLIKVIYS